MEQIYEPTDKFPLSEVVLTTPICLSNGTYFIKFLLHNNPIYIQPPKCKTRQGVIKGGKKMYCDLMFTNENIEFIRWIENLENYCQSYIFQNKTKWFQSELELHDIENSFTSSLKIFKSGKYYILRTIIPVRLGKCSLSIFDENEAIVDIDHLNEETNIISVLEFQGIRCSSRNFQIDIEAKQMMVVNDVPLFNQCVIRKNNKIENKFQMTTQQQQENTKKHEHEDEDEDEQEKKSNINDDKIKKDKLIISEIDITLDDQIDNETMSIYERDDVYRKIYGEAIEKIRTSRSLAITDLLNKKKIMDPLSLLKDI